MPKPKKIVDGKIKIIDGAVADFEENLESVLADLQTRIGELAGQLQVKNGAGQKQRVALARAFLRSPEILVLDEATSSLDVLTEERVRSSVRELMRGRTTLVITHRLHAVRDADRIAVLEGGRIVREGSHGELAGSRGAYRTFLRVCGDGEKPERAADA